MYKTDPKTDISPFPRDLGIYIPTVSNLSSMRKMEHTTAPFTCFSSHFLTVRDEIGFTRKYFVTIRSGRAENGVKHGYFAVRAELPSSEMAASPSGRARGKMAAARPSPLRPGSKCRLRREGLGAIFDEGSRPPLPCRRAQAGSGACGAGARRNGVLASKLLMGGLRHLRRVFLGVVTCPR